MSPAAAAAVAVAVATGVGIAAATSGRAGAIQSDTANAVATATPRLEISAVDPTGFTVDVRLAPPGTRAGRPATGGRGCRQPNARAGPDAEATGDEPPAWLIGVPGGTDGLGAVVDVLSVSETVTGWARACGGVGAWGPEPSDRDDGGHDPVAGNVLRLEPLGLLRHQPIARLVVVPAAPAGDGEIRVRTHVRARIRFTPGGTAGGARSDSAAFDPVLRVLANHAALPVPRTTPSVSAIQARPSRASDVTDQAEPAAAADPTALKIGVDRNGPVTMTGAMLAAAGWDLASVDPGALALETAGQPVAIAIDGAADGRLDPADRIVFHGQAMTGLYTRENVYWLRQTGKGVRMTLRDGAPDPAAPPARAFRATLRVERDTEYFISMRAGEGDDRWMWGPAISAAVAPPSPAFTTTLALPDLGPDPAPARLRVRLQGYASDPRVAPDHHVEVRLDGDVVADAWFDGPGVHVIEANLPSGVLTAGAHTLTVTCVGDTGAVVDSVFVNWIEIDHAAGYRAAGDRLDFAAPHPGRVDFTLTGFGAPDVQVLDVTSPEQPVAITGVAVERAGDGTYRARFGATATAVSRYVAYGPAGASPPARVSPNAASRWRSPEHGADYVVITHPDFAAAVAPLVRRRADQGLRTATILVDDAYDEFSAGVFDPRAIRDLLAYAFAHWAPPAPTYVLLVGESNLDYRRGYGQGPPNFVPSIQFDTTSRLTGDMGAATSDLWFAAVAGDDAVPDLLLGRLSVATAAQAEAVVAKTLRFETAPPAADWRRRAILVADDDGADLFEPFSDELAGHLPPDTIAERFYAGRYPRDRNLAADIGAAVNAGALVLNFTGHGNVDLWSPWPGGGRIFQNADITRLANGERAPLFTAATCMNGWIDHPLKPVSMAELWLTHPTGGGVAAWSPSGLATLSAQRQLLPAVFSGLFDGRGASIGALTTAAGAAVLARGGEWSDIARMFVLLGDPALVVAGAPAAPATPSAPTAAASPTAAATPRPPGRALFLPAASGG